MKIKITLILFTLIILGCNNRNNNTYIAVHLRGYKDNKITISEFDSIITNSPYWALDKFKTTNYSEAFALDLIRERLKKQNLNLNEYYICNISSMNDSTISFEIDHIDALVYDYKIKQQLKKQETDENYPLELVTGNITGLGAVYSVNIVSQEIKIYPFQ